MTGFDMMGKSAVAVGALSAITLTSIAVVNGYKDTGLIDNATADQFITGLGIFAAFTAVIVLALVGKIIVGLFKKGRD